MNKKIYECPHVRLTCMKPHGIICGSGQQQIIVAADTDIIYSTDMTEEGGNI